MTIPTTIGELHRYLRKDLEKIHPQEEANALSLIVMEHLFSSSRTGLLIQANRTITAGQWSKVTDILGELKQRKPIQYIVGTTTFYQLIINVTPAVLIPRPETEELVHWVISSMGPEGPTPNMLDAGTGSGCISIALAVNLPYAHLFGCDLSEDALILARQNAAGNHASVQYFRMDMLHPETTFPEPFFHVIVSNPPYIPLSRKETLQPEVSGYEPEDALFVPDDDPLIFYRAILRFGQRSLHKNGMVFFEVYEELAGRVAELCIQSGFERVNVRRDINGKERMIRAQRSL